MNDDVEQYGFAIIPRVVDAAGQRELLASLGIVSGAGRRGVLAVPGVSALACSPALLSIVRPHLSSAPIPVRAIYFDKTQDTNWQVPWHQDLTLAVAARVEVAGFGPWSIKDGVPHVQPPAEFLRQMLAVRLHLDDTDESNGALRVLPGSHLLGRLSAARISELSARQSDCICVVPAGGALLMRPLLLHASSRTMSRRHRRVLHIEYAAFALPSGLQWHEAV